MRLHGIIPATVTPMHEDSSIDIESLRRYARWLVEQGVHALALCADTGEGPHLWPEERKLVIQTVREEIGDSVPIVAGLSGVFTEQAAEEATMCREAGADALLVFPLGAFRGSPQSLGMVREYHALLYREAGLPLVMFQLQDALGGVEFDVDTLTCLAQTEGVIAIKEASFDANKYVRTVRHLRANAPELSILSGNDNFVAESLVMGADGLLIGFGTLCVKEQVEMYDAAVSRDFPKVLEIGSKVQPLADHIFSAPVRDYRARTKEALRQMGVIQHSYVRAPLSPLNDSEKLKLTEALRAAGQIR